MPRTEAETISLVSKNMGIFRRRSSLTQSEVAELINYSDKSVSKWERGEALPDFYILSRLAEIYSVNIDDFLNENAKSVKVQKKFFAPLSWRSKLLITILSVGLAWLLATVVYFILSVVGIDKSSLGIVYYCAVPVSAIVLTVFTLLWFKRIFAGLSISALIWSVAYGISHYIHVSGISTIYIIAAVLQILAILWYFFLKLRERERRKSIEKKSSELTEQ